MLQIIVPGTEMYNEATNTFADVKDQVLQLEHSLVSLSKWESKWCKPFLDKKEKTTEETFDYVRCMTISQNVPDDVYQRLTDENIEAISKYIDTPMTATTFAKNDKKAINREIVTAEIIYYWMIALNVPFEPCQKWHLNRLLTLINVCNIKNQPPKKLGRREQLSQQRALNEARKAKYHTTG